MILVVVLLLLAAISTPGHLMSMEFGFGFGIENGIEKSTCSAKFKVTYKKHVLIDGIKSTMNQTDTISTRECCEGYNYRNGDCFPINPAHPCYNLTCQEHDAECVVVKRCGHNVAIFMKDDEIVRDCHPPGYLNLLTCVDKCPPDVCSPSLCPKLNHSEVVCDVIRGCPCKPLWRRKRDQAVMDCTTAAEDSLQCSFSFSDVLSLFEQNLSKVSSSNTERKFDAASICEDDKTFSIPSSLPEMTSYCKSSNTIDTATVSHDEASTVSNLWNTTMSDKGDMTTRSVARLASASIANSDSSTSKTGTGFEMSTNSACFDSLDEESDAVYCWIPKSDRGFQTHDVNEDTAHSDTRSSFSESASVTKRSSPYSSLVSMDESKDHNTQVSVIKYEGEIKCCINSGPVIATESEGVEFLAHETDLVANNDVLNGSSFLDNIIYNSNTIEKNHLQNQHIPCLPTHLAQCCSPVLSCKKSSQLLNFEQPKGQLHKTRLMEQDLELLPSIHEGDPVDNHLPCTCMESAPESISFSDKSRPASRAGLRRHRRDSSKSTGINTMSYKTNSSIFQHQQRCQDAQSVLTNGTENSTTVDSSHSFLRRSSGTTSSSSEVSSSVICTCHLGKTDSQWSVSESALTGKLSSSGFSGPGFGVNSYDCLSSISQVQHRRHTLSDRSSHCSSTGNLTSNSSSSLKEARGSRQVPWSPIGSIFTSNLSNKYELACIPETESSYVSPLQRQHSNRISDFNRPKMQTSSNSADPTDMFLNTHQSISALPDNPIGVSQTIAPVTARFTKLELVKSSFNCYKNEVCTKSKSFSGTTVQYNEIPHDSHIASKQNKRSFTCKESENVFLNNGAHKTSVASQCNIGGKIPASSSCALTQEKSVEQHSSTNANIKENNILPTGSSSSLTECNTKDPVAHDVSDEVKSQQNSQSSSLPCPEANKGTLSYHMTTCEIGTQTALFYDINSMLMSNTISVYDEDACMNSEQPHNVVSREVCYPSLPRCTGHTVSDNEQKLVPYQSYRIAREQLKTKHRVPFLLCGPLSKSPMILNAYSHIDIFKTKIINQVSPFHDGHSLKDSAKYRDEFITNQAKEITHGLSTCSNASLPMPTLNCVTSNDKLEEPHDIVEKAKSSLECSQGSDRKSVTMIESSQANPQTVHYGASKQISASSLQTKENSSVVPETESTTISDFTIHPPKRKKKSIETNKFKIDAHHKDKVGLLRKLLKTIFCCCN